MRGRDVAPDASLPFHRMTSATEQHGSVSTTDGIVVRVTPSFMPDHSDPEANRYIFSYTIHIANESTRPVTLQSRHWVVVDANGNRQDVEGEGVIGKQPRIDAGGRFEYSSWCPLNTPWGTMEGHYMLLDADGREFEVAIGRFYLVSDDA